MWTVRTSRIAGRRSSTPLANTCQPTPMASTVATLVASASGPARARPIGPTEKAPNVTYDVTRDIASGGTPRWTVVVHSVPKTVLTVPAVKAVTPTTASGALSASAADGAAQPNPTTVAATSGRPGRQARPTRPPAIAPAP